jgi:hypothetical protein
VKYPRIFLPHPELDFSWRWSVLGNSAELRLQSLHEGLKAAGPCAATDRASLLVTITLRLGPTAQRLCPRSSGHGRAPVRQLVTNVRRSALRRSMWVNMRPCGAPS